MAIAQISQSRSDDLDLALGQARQEYLGKRPESIAAFNNSIDYMPGGNTRTVLFHGPVPLRMVSGDGCRVTDADGFEYVNMLGEYSAGLFGHNNPVIRAAIDQALDRGISLSGHNPDEIELARRVCERFPSIEKVRFTNSGTEANLFAISIAKYHTKRDTVMVFNGGYHGGLLYFRAGGTPINAPFDYIFADYNDIDATRDLIRQHDNDLACVLVEPMQGAPGCIPGSPEFLAMLRQQCTATESVLIFDEVMTSRLSPSGAQGMLNITPDMTTLGKYIGGGLTFGAFGGGKKIMGVFDPRLSNAVPHAGTFNNNSLTMAAGVAAMGKVLTVDALNQLNQRGEKLREQLNDIAVQHGARLQFTGIGSLLAMHPTRKPVRSVKDLAECDDRVTELVFLDLLERGYYIARRGYMALMLPLGDQELDGFKQAFTDILCSRGNFFPLVDV